MSNNEKKFFFIKIKNTKNNTFICLNNMDGRLIMYKSLKTKKNKDSKITYTWAMLMILKKIKDFKIKFINLFLTNVDTDSIQHIFILIKTWNISINYIKYDINTPHNGCRKTHLPRKRNKGIKKNTTIMGL